MAPWLARTWPLWLAGALLLAGKARAAGPVGGGGVGRVGLVEGGRDPGPAQRYLFQRSPTHWHRGIDIGAPAGSRVFAPLPGRVAAVWPDGTVSGYGNAVVLQHAQGDQTLFAHLEAFGPGVQRGAVLPRGAVVGYVGSTQAPRPAMQSAPHLHFEVHTRHDLRIREDNPPRAEPLAWLAAQRARVAA